MGDARPLRILCLEESQPLGERLAALLGAPSLPIEDRRFPDGEHKLRTTGEVTGCDVVVVQSLAATPDLSAHDKLMRLILLAGSAQDAGAASVTLVIPYLCYARKDHRTQKNDPVATRYVARLLETVEPRAVIGLDVHEVTAFENAFRRPTGHLTATAPFVRAIGSALAREEAAVMAPDLGGVKRAEAFRQGLEERLGRPVPLCVMEKYRSAGQVTGSLFAGDPSGRVVVVFDDMVSSGGTLARATAACLERGAKRVIAAVTHGVFLPDTAETLTRAGLSELFVSDSLPRGSLGKPFPKMRVVEIAPLLADAVRALAGGAGGELPVSA